MASFTLKGMVKFIGETQQVTDTFKKREFVVTEQDGQYPQHVLFQTGQDRTDLLNDLKVGDLVEVNFNLRGREWTNPQGEVKYFNSMDCWSLSIVSESSTPTQTVEEGESDLPF